MRENGYYWVTPIGASEPEVALFIENNKGGCWLIAGSGASHADRDMSEID
ncbi:MAG: hypothetical protein RR390_00430 [Hafnia sp.]